MLKKKHAELKNIVGEHPKDEQSKLIFWNVLDPESKRLAATGKFADVDYNAMKTWICMRYNIAPGNLEYKPQTNAVATHATAKDISPATAHRCPQ